MAKRKKRKRTVWIVIAAVVAVLVVLGMLVRSRAPDFDTVVANTDDIVTYYNFSGTVAATNAQTVYADKALQVASIHVSEGQLVREDDLLMTTSLEEEIRAPLAGTVILVTAEADAQLVPGAPLCRIVDYTSLELVVNVDEYDLSAIETGENATVTIHSLDLEMNGTIRDISREGVHQGGITIFQSTITIPENPEIRVGMTAEASLVNHEAYQVTVLPMSAIQFDDDNNPYVFVDSGRRVPDRLDVTLGIEDGVSVEILSGVTGGDTVWVPMEDMERYPGFSRPFRDDS